MRAGHNDRQQGWRAELSYESKTFTTGTNGAGGMIYSTNGFRDLQDVLGVRRKAKRGLILPHSDTASAQSPVASGDQPLGRQR